MIALVKTRREMEPGSRSDSLGKKKNRLLEKAGVVERGILVGLVTSKGACRPAEKVGMCENYLMVKAGLAKQKVECSPRVHGALGSSPSTLETGHGGTQL